MFGPSLLQFLSHLSYVGVAAYMGTVGYILPVPEEAALIIFGFLTGTGKFYFWYVYGAAVFGLLLGDNIFYWLAYSESRYILHFKKRIREEVWQKYEQLYRDNFGKTLVLLRFLVGFRFLGPAIAGTLKIRYRKFFFYDTAVGLGYVGTFIFLGFSFRHQLPLIITLVEHFRNLLLSAAIVAAVIWLIRVFTRGKSG